jgi:protein-disulfide isomerase
MRFLRLAKAGLVAVLVSAPPVAAQNLVRSDSASRGPVSAPVTVVLFCDFQCQHCASVRGVANSLAETYPNDVRFVYRHFPMSRVHPQATLAAEAAECASDQNKFWPMYDSMFANQRSLDEEGLRRQARAVGIDVSAFTQCLRTSRHEPTWKRDFADATAAGVSGTPTFFVNGQLAEGVEALNDLDALIQGALGR